MNDSNKDEPVAPDLNEGDNSDQEDGMGEIVNEFLVESYENLDQLDQDLINLEQSPGDINILSSIFRTIHTIKGTCGFIGFTKLESVAHIGENLLGKLRDGELALNPARTSALLAMVDAIRQMLSCIENDANEGSVDYSGLVETLTQLQTDSDTSDSPAEPVASKPEVKEEVTPVAAAEKAEEPTAESPEPIQPSAEIDEDMEPIVNEFLVESYENLDRLDKDLIELEQDPGNTEILSSIFRTIHTIKGTCGFIGLHKLERVAHVGENLLGKLRDGELALNPPRTSALLAMVDAIRQMLDCIESNRNEGDVDYSALVDTLGKLLTDEGSAEVAAVAPEPEAAQAQPPVEEKQKEEKAFVPAAEKVDRRQSSPEEQAEHVAKSGDKRATDDRRKETRGVADSSIRVDVDILDRLMNLVGELVLARNQILQYSPAQSDSTFIATSQHLNLVTTELQEGVMKTRMQPIGNIWSKFPRVVRDLSMAVGKKIRLEMEGKETELDKTLIEAIKDPLTHIVRNSCDHGIETP